VNLVFVEPGQEELSLQAVAVARRLGGPVEAVTFGASAEYAPEAWAQAIVDAAAGASVVLAAATDRGSELLAYAAAKLDAPLAANCVAVEPGDPLTVTRQRWGGSLLEEARVSGPVKFLTVTPHVFAAEGSAPEAVELTPAASSGARVVRREEPEVGKVLLTDARVVVGGGRGVGSAEGFKALEELADLLGGAVGGSRVVTNLGWRSHADQIGQTGARIAPELYIACGISGAIQHIVGCKAAKRILAINTDKDAPMVARADYAVIGDVQEILPAVVQELRR
jgi:electron transfer flavoprotein alpha subunit